MRIDGTFINGVGRQAASAQPHSATSAHARALSAAGDRVVLSDVSMQLAALRAVVGSDEDVRTELVERVRDMVRTGRYTIDPRKVADRFLRETMLG